MKWNARSWYAEANIKAVFTSDQMKVCWTILSVLTDSCNIMITHLSWTACLVSHPLHLFCTCLLCACLWLSVANFALRALYLIGPSCTFTQWPSSGQSMTEVPLRWHLDRTNSTVFLSISVGSVSLFGRPAVGSPRETLGSGRTLRLAAWQRTNQRQGIFTLLPCCLLAPTYWLSGSF